MVPINKRYEKRETKREAKALIAAKLENAIEKELLTRLQAGTYKDIYNLQHEDFNKALDEEEIQQEFEEDISEEDDDSLIGADIEGGESDMSEDEVEELEREIAQQKALAHQDSDDEGPVLGKRAKSGVSLSYEYEFEEEKPKAQKRVAKQSF